jgi:SAM-dependent methyltransferase
MSGPAPWLHIPLAEYEAHMEEIGQASALRETFRRVYSDLRPRRLLILGCTTGRDFEVVDPSVTTVAVGVDLNAEYLDAARGRLDALRGTLQLVHGDVLEVDLPSSGFDLIYAALLFEYVDPALLFARIARWLAPGGVCIAVTQNPADGVPSVTRTSHGSMDLLSGCMSLHRPEEIGRSAVRAGLTVTEQTDISLPHGKSFSTSRCEKVR